MFPAVTAASSAIDALKALTSTKPTTGVNQTPRTCLAFFCGCLGIAGGELPGPVRQRSPISAETMSALLAAQSQSGSSTSAPTSRSAALGPVRADRRRSRRQDHESGIRCTLRRRHQYQRGRRRLQQARQGRRRLGEPWRIDVGAEGQDTTAIIRRSTDPATPRKPTLLQVAAGRIEHISHQFRWFGDDVPDLCRWFEGDDDFGREFGRRDLVLQCRRERDPAPGQHDFGASEFIPVCQRLVLRWARDANRSGPPRPVTRPERAARSHHKRPARSRGLPHWRRPCRVR